MDRPTRLAPRAGQGDGQNADHSLSRFVSTMKCPFEHIFRVSSDGYAASKVFRSRLFPLSVPATSSTSSGTSTPTTTAAPAAGSSSSSAQGPGQKKRGKKTLAERAGIGQSLPPRKLEDAGLDEEEQMAKLAEAFGGMGTVYRKKQVKTNSLPVWERERKRSSHRQAEVELLHLPIQSVCQKRSANKCPHHPASISRTSLPSC